MILLLYIQCIYKARKSGKKTNRCQKINVQKLFNIRLQIEFYLITLQTYPTIDDINQNNAREIKSRANINTKFL